MSTTHETTLVIDHPAGLHMRPAAIFVKTASRFTSQIQITNLSRDSNRSVDAKSMLSLIQIGVSQGHEVKLRATGDDAAEAVAALKQLITSDFESTP